MAQTTERHINWANRKGVVYGEDPNAGRAVAVELLRMAREACWNAADALPAENDMIERREINVIALDISQLINAIAEKVQGVTE